MALVTVTTDPSKLAVVPEVAAEATFIFEEYNGVGGHLNRLDMDYFTTSGVKLSSRTDSKSCNVPIDSSSTSRWPHAIRVPTNIIEAVLEKSLDRMYLEYAFSGGAANTATDRDFFSFTVSMDF